MSPNFTRPFSLYSAFFRLTELLQLRPSPQTNRSGVPRSILQRSLAREASNAVREFPGEHGRLAMKVNLMSKLYALNIAVTAEELKDKPAKVIRKYIRAARRCYPRLASQNNQRGYNYRWAVPTTRPCPAGRRGPSLPSIRRPLGHKPLEPPRDLPRLTPCRRRFVVDPIPALSARVVESTSPPVLHRGAFYRRIELLFRPRTSRGLFSPYSALSALWNCFNSARERRGLQII